MLFESHKLVHNITGIKKIALSSKGGGAFAVVDVVFSGRTKRQWNIFIGKDESLKSILT